MAGNNSLPKGCVWNKLGDVIDIRYGYSFRSNDYQDEGVLLVRQSNIGGNKIELEKAVYLPEDFLEKHSDFIINKGDILIGMSGSIGKLCEYNLDSPALQNQRTGLVKFKDPRTKGYIRYFFGTLDRQLSSLAKGVAVQNISAKQIKELDIPIPPLPEQERIVTKIEETFTQLEAGIAELQNAKAQLKRYRVAVLKSAVEGELTREWRQAHQGEIEPAEKLLAHILEERRKKWEAEGKKGKYKEPAVPNMDSFTELPEGWVWASLEQSASFEPRSIQSGPFGSSLLHSEFQETGILAIGIDNVLDGKFSMGKQHRISQKKYGELEKYTARPLDILITVMATVGRCCVVPADLETAIITKHVYRISANQELINSYFLMYCLLAESVTRHQIFGGVRGQTRPGINKSVLVNLAIPIPPLREQERIVEKIERRLSVADEIEKELDESLVRAERLRGSILKNAFEGKL